MASNQQRYAVRDLQPGMFISKLDRPWSETPFPLQGFYINGQKEIDNLSVYSRYVYVDMEISRSVDGYDIPEARSSQRRTQQSHAHGSAAESAGELLKVPPVKLKSRVDYIAPVTPLKKEVSKAERIYNQVRAALVDVFDRARNGDRLCFSETSQAAEGLVDSVIRNPDALVWLTRVQKHDDYSFRHSTTAAVWSLVFGRLLGLDREQLKHLAMGVLLARVGIAKLPKALLDKQSPLSAEERVVFKGYVDLSLEMLKADASIPAPVLMVVQYHRERHNGTGFPQQVNGLRIPLLGKIAGLVDHYQELLEPRFDSKMSSVEAVSRLYEVRNILFQEDLVEQFIRAVGVYPPGSLVELNNDEVGVVIANHEERRLWPKVMVVLNKVKQPLKQGKIVDLYEVNAAKDADFLQIAASLPAGSYDIDASAYLVTGATSKFSFRHWIG
ncbi:MAG: DUF3391 domain-containing protein [Hahellaceae bacterium]|nr:DUF3391 domain-containing protein [Hahellaceae bacterium]